ncbi:hypothetical protein MRB53_024312 [Persea americana]|uniref:Uncharacterized protein n=1 Tax=Persea americana TaxID=3435 RepID=A0ACC2LD84_PERAE|nr:hypothetical protein MRB53_024312 [Persea americana]
MLAISELLVLSLLLFHATHCSIAVLGRVKDFIGVMAAANKRLQLDAQENSREKYDIEVLNGNESNYIEMDLLLGVADLHTPEAVAAAESAIAGSVSTFPVSASSSGSDAEDTDDDDDSLSSRNKCRKERLDKDDTLSSEKRKKRPKITELP